MKIAFYYLQGSKESWAEEAQRDLESKISHFLPIEVVALKSKSLGRDKSQIKTKDEEKKLLSVLSKDDFVILFDERGKRFKDSVDFSQFLVKCLEMGKQRVVFVIGGPYGFTEDLKKSANQMISLSALTMNHHIAKIVGLEQIYRGLTIWKGIKYHNS